MNTNRSGVKENAFANIDKKKYDENYDHIFGKKNKNVCADCTCEFYGSTSEDEVCPDCMKKYE